MPKFSAAEFLPLKIREMLCSLRVCDPDRALRTAKSRKRRARLTVDGKLSIVAADHPARRVTKVGDDPLGAADRHAYLARVLRVLASETIDGVMATMDILEDLLVIPSLVLDAGGPALVGRNSIIPTPRPAAPARTNAGTYH